MATYVVPQVLVFQEFAIIPTEITQALRAHISGPHAHKLSYTDPDEHDLLAVGAYDPGTNVGIEWPQKPLGATISAPSVKVYFERARLRYFRDTVGSGQTVAPVANKPNKVRIGGTYGFVDNGAGFSRFPSLGERDVQVNDKVTLQSSGGTLDTFVAAIEADLIAAAINPDGDPVADAGNNFGTQSAAMTVTYTGPGGLDNGSTLAADGTDYSALRDGYLSDTYTIEVTQASTSGDLSTARLRITTASGLDDDTNVIPAATTDEFQIGRRGLVLTFTSANLLVGQKWRIVANQAYTALAGTASGTYRGAIDTTYIATVTRGGFFNDPDPDRRPQISVRTAHGVDAAAPITITATGSAFPVGSQGVLLAINAGPTALRRGDRFNIPVVAGKAGRMSTLVLGHNLSSGMRAASDMDLTLAIEKDVQVDRYKEDGTTENFAIEDNRIVIRSGIVAYDEGFQDGLDPLPLPIIAASMYVEYLAWLQELTGDVFTIADIAELDDAISGPLHPDNPLKWAVHRALLNSNGTPVKYTAVADPDSFSAWSDVLEVLVGRDDIYNLVPLTYDPQVLLSFAGHVKAQASPENGRWRACFLGLQAKTTRVVSAKANTDNGLEILATIADDPDLTGTQYTFVEVKSGNGNFLTQGVRPGDILRTNFGTDATGTTYDEYYVDRIISEETLVLADGPLAPVSISSGQKIEIWHPLSKNETAQDVAQQAAVYSDSRVVAVWPDKVASGGTWMPGYHVCAALAGLRSGVPPHAPLTNTELIGFDDLARSSVYFNTTQLNTLAGAGVWIVTQSPTGQVYTRHGRTTDVTSINSVEESVRTNVDSMSYVFLNRLSPFIGRMNVTPSALSILKIEIEQIIGFLKSSPFEARLGPQLIDADIVQLRPHLLLKDRVVAIVNITIPYPLNNLEVHLVV